MWHISGWESFHEYVKYMKKFCIDIFLKEGSDRGFTHVHIPLQVGHLHKSYISSSDLFRISLVLKLSLVSNFGCDCFICRLLSK